MGLTSRSTGRGAAKSAAANQKAIENTKTVALAGNPNVGKSTVFNGLTGMKQHTGNWAGKTVAVAEGICKSEEQTYRLVDIPGTYSLLPHSTEEEVARNFICFGDADAVLVVCDATCLERNLTLVLQILEVTPRVLVCVNLMDEAKRKKLSVSVESLSKRLGAPAVGITARSRRDLAGLCSQLDSLSSEPTVCSVRYPSQLEAAISALQACLQEQDLGRLSARWLACKLLEGDPSLDEPLHDYLGYALLELPTVRQALAEALAELAENGYQGHAIEDAIAATLLQTATSIAKSCVKQEQAAYQSRDRRLDRLLTGRAFGYPVMLALLLLTFFLTIILSNYPSAWLSSLFVYLEEQLSRLFVWMHAPPWLHGILVEGAFRTLGWVVSVMLPPMAIFFPMFTLLEDAGYLPRIAYNLDRPFCKCNACGKQALTMCMGFGCNAAGVVGCRIVDSKRERLLAMLTNSFVPCNGKFGALIALITIFLVGSQAAPLDSVLSALLLALVILLSVGMTFLVTKLLSVTVLRGEPSSYTLELPPYRRPQVLRVLVRSLLDRTLFVLGRAAAVAAPAGLLLWLLANITVNDLSLLRYCADLLDPFASLLGVDGVILIAFVFGFPANEIVMPIMFMAYLSKGGLFELGDLGMMREVLVANGWTWQTAVCVILLFLFHAPCSTTLITIKKETGSLRYTLLAALLPTLIGILLCMAFTATVRLFA